MKVKIWFLAVLLSFVSLCYSQNLRFEQNLGQWDSEVLFMAKTSGTNIFLTQSGVTFLSHSAPSHHHPNDEILYKGNSENPIDYHAFKLKLTNANTTQIIPQNEQIGYSNYFVGNDTTKWRGGVKAYSNVIYKDIYPNIDWVVYSQEGNFKHDFIVHSNANLADIVIEYSGLNNLQLKNGNLVMQTSLGEVVEHKPIVYQQDKEKRIEVEAEFLLDNNKVSYRIKNYRQDLDLVIDPTLIFSTYSGSYDDNWGFTATYDNKGYLYAGGISKGISGYPTTDTAYRSTNNGFWDVTITKFSPDGSTLIYSTYLGGNNTDFPSSLYVNEFGELLVLGITSSLDFPNINAFQPSFGGGHYIEYDNIAFNNGTDIFVCKFSNDGRALLASTYVGGSGNDGLNFRNGYDINGSFNRLYANYGDGVRGELITDDRNNVYVGSCTFSDDFYTSPNAFQKTFMGNQEGVVFKLDHTLSNMLFSSYIGGSDDDAIFSIDVDSSYRLYVTGGTKSTDFPFSANAYQQIHNGGNVDCFLSLISYDGSQLLASTYYGSEFYDQSYFVRTDRNNCPHIFGQTKADGSQMIYGNVLNEPGGGQLLAKFTPMLDSLMWSGVFSGQNRTVNISPTAFGVDNCGRLYLTGWGRVWKSTLMSSNTNFGTYGMPITSNAYQPATDGQDFYIASFDTDPLSLNYGTFFGEVVNGNSHWGTDHVDGGTSRFDKFGSLYQSVCASCGGSNGFTTFPQGTVWSDTNRSNNCNLAAFRFNIHNDFAVADFDIPPVLCAPANIAFVNNSRGDGFLWSFGDGTTSTDDNPTHTYSQRGVYDVMLISHLDDACWSSDTIIHQVIVLGNGRDTLPTLETCYGTSIQIGLVTPQANNVTYQWYPQTLLSNSTIADPYATMEDTIVYTLVISANGCSDTIVQQIDLRRILLQTPDTIQTCNYPARISMNALDQYHTIASLHRDFSDTIIVTKQPLQSSFFDIATFEDCYIYFKQTDNGCEAIDSTWIDFNGAIIDLQTSPVTCPNADDGAITAHITNISHSSIYIVYNPTTGNSFPIALTADTIINILGYNVGNYFLEVQSSGCITHLDFSIAVGDTLSVTYQKRDNPCSAAHVGYITLSITGGESPFDVQWSNSQNGTTISNLGIGTYSYILTDSKGCIIEDTIEIVVADSLVMNVTHTENNCMEGCSAEAIAAVSGGLPPLQYQWTNGDTTPASTDLCVGNHTITVTDSAGCQTKSTIYVGYSNIFENVIISASKTRIYDGETIRLTASPQIDGVTYQWTPATYLTDPYSYTTLATLYEPTTFYVFITDGKGCNYFDSIKIDVDVVVCDKPNIHVPNIFTPNGDGKNDVLFMTGDYVRSIKFMIFDRWGEKVFETDKQNEGWDGRFRGQDCQNGVYYYRLEVECEANRNFSTSGDVTLIR
ncbi:MAG: gliding motility-associated C-terminal domain-containing protein [Bacteroidales bacterium]|jgi:gliding motility-associated-like protein|nr:gliding motility-associated C-terminal domain-containing protein [Bacteroidales bacterium]